MRFEGYMDTSKIPFKPGQSVKIPAGVVLHSMEPDRSFYEAKRNRTITVHHIMCGISVMASDALRYYSDVLGAQKVSELEALRNSDYAAFSRLSIPVKNPSVIWAGRNGYWQSADVNDLLEANGVQ